MFRDFNPLKYISLLLTEQTHVRMKFDPTSRLTENHRLSLEIFSNQKRIPLQIAVKDQISAKKFVLLSHSRRSTTLISLRTIYVNKRDRYNLRMLIVCALISSKTSYNVLTLSTPNLTSNQPKTVFVAVRKCVNDHLKRARDEHPISS